MGTGISRLSLRPPQRSGTGSLGNFAMPVAEAWSLVNSLRWWARPVRDATIAYVCSCFSELAYLHLNDRELDPSGRYKLVPSLGFHALRAAGVSFDLRSIGDLDIPNFVVETEEYLYAGFVMREVATIAVRGTRPTSLVDWGVNSAFIPKRTGVGAERLHSGFLKEARRAAPLIAGQIQKLGRTEAVRFTGHSLGGAVASILHRIWPAESLGAYAFGSPRIGDAESVDRLPPFAYRRPWDLVPHAPPLWLGYRDADRQMEVMLERPGDPVPSLGAVLWDWTPRPGGKPFAIQHAIERYRARLGRSIAQTFPDLVYWDYAQRMIREAATPPGKI